jgi:hypothetical protein
MEQLFTHEEMLKIRERNRELQKLYTEVFDNDNGRRVLRNLMQAFLPQTPTEEYGNALRLAGHSDVINHIILMGNILGDTENGR